MSPSSSPSDSRSDSSARESSNAPDASGDGSGRPRRRRRGGRGRSRKRSPAESAGTDAPAEADASAETDAPAETEAPAEAETPALSDAPASTETPAADESNDTVDADEGGPVEVDVADCKFAEFGLRDDLLRGIASCGYRDPSPIQARVLPYALEGRDIIGQARTGTGKTAAFLVPALQMLSDKPGVRVCVVAPTRELAHQVAKEAERLGKHMGVESVAIYGGAPMKAQLDALRRGAQVVAATPGRLLDHLGRRTLKLEDLDVLTLDEADRMFDLGFRDDIDKIMRYAPRRRQTFLFSATLDDEVLRLASKHMNDPAEVFLAPDKMTVDEVDQLFYTVEPERKTALLVHLLKLEKPDKSIIFTRTKIGADKLAMRLQKRNLAAQELHSGLPQRKRESILGQFRSGEFPYLIATDVAARGIDIDDVSHVINYDIPENPEDYVHRIGRTARMGKRGRAATFVTRDDGDHLTAIEKLINQEIVGETVEGFEHLSESQAEPRLTQEELQKKKASQYVRSVRGVVRKRPRR